MRRLGWLVTAGSLIVTVLLTSGIAPCDAWGGGGGHGGGSHGGGRHGGGHHGGHGGGHHGGWRHGGRPGAGGWVGGIGFAGFPLWYPNGDGAVYGYAYPAIGEAPPPVVYIEREPPPEYWYYCREPQGYYPQVGECPGGWVKVAPRPRSESPQ
jgi:hypothetical protein